MGILEEIAKGGTSRPVSWKLKGQQEKRAGRLADLQYQVAEKKLGKMEAEEDLLTSRKETISGVDFEDTETPYRDLAKMFAEKGDTEFATLYQGFASARQKMDAADKKGMDDKLADFNDFYTNEAKVISKLQSPEEITSEYANFRQQAIERFPKLSESLPENADPAQIMQEAQKQIIRATDMDDFLGTSAKGTSEVERLVARKKRGEKLNIYEQSRLELLTGLKGRPSTEGTQGRHDDRMDRADRRLELQKEGFTEKKATTQAKKEQDLRKEATKGMEHFGKMETAINGALAAIESGNNGLSDMLLTQVMSQIQDTNVRAFQMYKVADAGFGNIAERVTRSVGRWATGTRTDAEKAEIAETLNDFLKNHVQPGSKDVRSRYRGLATDSKVDKYRVIPPMSIEEIRNDKTIDRDRKLELLEHFFPEKF